MGSSAEGLKDTHTTLFDRRLSGVEVHATTVGAILDRDFISIPGWTVGVQGVGAFFAVLLALTIVLQFSTWATGLTSFVPKSTSKPWLNILSITGTMNIGSIQRKSICCANPLRFMMWEK
ncbi:MAG: hypothetical protein ACD_75C02490G0008 [uncultured bacterium]|nr:MAG: hypothetical protein ACD_75C02490G0008 [uncultured bacterium]